jgi:hypothetical protein
MTRAKAYRPQPVTARTTRGCRGVRAERDDHRSNRRSGEPGKGYGFRSHRLVWGWIADPIWASGHAAAPTGRTHDRTRPDCQVSRFFFCIQGAVHTCPCEGGGGNGEARTRDEREALDTDRTGAKAIGWSGVVIGDGEPGRCGEPATRLDRVVKRRDPCGRSQGVGVEARTDRKLHPRAGVRALIVALKPGDAGGAKGGRKVET